MASCKEINGIGPRNGLQDLGCLADWEEIMRTTRTELLYSLASAVQDDLACFHFVETVARGIFSAWTHRAQASLHSTSQRHSLQKLH